MADVIYYDEWGLRTPENAGKYGRDESAVFLLGVPRSAGCRGVLMDESSYDVQCKYGVRVMHLIGNDAGDDDKVSCAFKLAGSADNDVFGLKYSAAAQWDHGTINRHMQEHYPDNGTDFNATWTREYAPGSSVMKITIYAAAVTDFDSVIYGFEVSTNYDNSTTAEVPPVWDWSDPDISNSQRPASSVVVMKALAETYNRIVSEATWAIQAAIPGTYDEHP